MTKITIYDHDEERIDAITEKYDLSDSMLINILLDAIEDGDIDLDEII